MIFGKQFHFIYLFHSQNSYKNLNYIYIYMHTHSHTDTHIHGYAYIYMYTVYSYARVHVHIIINISTAVLRKNETCRRLRVLSSSPEKYTEINKMLILKDAHIMC